MSKVLKFGGTSVGSPESMRRVAEIVIERKSTITVLSAMSGTTDILVQIVSHAAQNSTSKAESLMGSLVSRYNECIDNLLSSGREEAQKHTAASFGIIRRNIEEYRPYYSEREIIAQGEIMTSRIFYQYLCEIGVNAKLLYTPDLIKKTVDGKQDIDHLILQLNETSIASDIVYIAQGFICSDSNGSIDNLGRGGSDFTAALMGAAINASEVEIWTDIDGMHNNDPRYVDNTYPIRRMSFDEAAELAYFGAKILHPATILPCKEKNIPVLLKNTMNPSAYGTVISDTDDPDTTFHAVAAKDNITVIRICSTRMLMAYGFLRKVFEIFENHTTPIDMITTSEVAISLTIDNDEQLEHIVRELKELGNIEVESNNSIVCVVGNIAHDRSGLASDILSGITSIPLKMISYGASHRSLALLISTDHKKELLRKLNTTLFTQNNSIAKNF